MLVKFSANSRYLCNIGRS